MSDLEKELNMNEEKFGLAEQLEHTVSVMCDETVCPEMPIHPDSGFAVDLRAAAVELRRLEADNRRLREGIEEHREAHRFGRSRSLTRKPSDVALWALLDVPIPTEETPK